MSEDPTVANREFDEEVLYGGLRDGTPVRLRTVRPGDRAGVLAFVRRLSIDSLELRFFSAVSLESAADEVLGSRPTGPERVSLIAETAGASSPEIIGHAEFVRSPVDEERAEAAFLIADAFQGRGAGTLLLRALARVARRRGIRRLEAVVLGENQCMLDMFTGAGYPHSTRWLGSEAHVEIDIDREPPIDARWGPNLTGAAST